MDEETAVKIVETTARTAGDEEHKARGKDVRTTAEKIRKGEPTTGGPTAVELLEDGERVVGRLREWLGGPEEWAAPAPFEAQTGPPFPLEALPIQIRHYIAPLSESLQIPNDLAGVLVLGVGAASAAHRAVVRLNPDWWEPLNEFYVIVLPSGERKSPAFRVITAPLQEAEQALVEKATPEIEIAGARRVVVEQSLKHAQRQAAKEGAPPSEMTAVENLARGLSESEVPASPRLLAGDVTPEAIATLLAEQNGRIAIVDAEGGLFEVLAGRYSNGIPNLDGILKGHSGDAILVDRKGREPESILKPALTLLLTVQPDVVRGLGGKEGFRGRGLLARIKYAIPLGKVGYRSNDAPSMPEYLREQWGETVRGILSLPETSEADEHEIALSPEAHEVFQAFRNEVEVQLRPNGGLAGLADWGSKLPGSVARFAGVLHLFAHTGQETPWSVPISLETMTGAIELGRYFTAHAQVAFGVMAADWRAEKARTVWAAIQRHDLARFTVRDLHQIVRRQFNQPAQLEGVLSLLVEMGYVRQVHQDLPGKAGRRPSPIFEVNPLTNVQNTQTT